MRPVRTGINGMGRIGRLLTRLIVTEYADALELTAVNDIASVDEVARALRRDSTYGAFPAEVEAASGAALRIGGRIVPVHNSREPGDIPWRDAGVELVFECTGRFLTSEKVAPHLEGGAGRVVISAPPKDGTPVFVIGVNHDMLTGEETIVSNASCTTNALAPVVKALDDAFGVVSGLATTTHAATSGQSVVDGLGSERARAALNNIIPTSTGAARAVGRAIPHLEGKLNSSGLRVPVTTGSVVEAVLAVRGAHAAADVVAALESQAALLNAGTPTGRVLYVGDDYQVSADAVGSAWSSMVLARGVLAVPCGEDTLVKVTAFYDNELGYAYRLAEMGIALARAAAGAA